MISFKQFIQLDEEQLNELFGVFRNNKTPPQTQRPGQNTDKDVDWALAKKIADKKQVLTPAEKARIKNKMLADAKKRTDKETQDSRNAKFASKEPADDEDDPRLMKRVGSNDQKLRQIQNIE
jgi:hypothetical protein